MNGTKASCRSIGTKLSVIVVSTCAAVNASASSDMFRCRPIVMNRGQ